MAPAMREVWSQNQAQVRNASESVHVSDRQSTASSRAASVQSVAVVASPVPPGVPGFILGNQSPRVQ